MYKRLFTTVLVLLCGAAVAQQVPAEVAQRVALNFWNTHRPANLRAATSAEQLPVNEVQHMYIFAIGEESFVVVADDYRVRPILGYSFDSPASAKLNPEVRYWLRIYEQQIASLGDKSLKPDPRWAQFADSPVPPTPVSLTHVPAICKTKWGQDEPYNNLCPWDEYDEDRAVVGCVATAMAQVMKRWDHPSCGTGNHSYHHSFMDNYGYDYGELSADFSQTTYMWQDMPNKITYAASDAEASALSTLSYHCGVSVDMMYGTHAKGGSGAYSECYDSWGITSCATKAFWKYFKYDSTTIHYEQRNGYTAGMSYITDSAWAAMIDAELAEGRPIYYSGSDKDGGHAFVCDGSNLDSTYHFNWGWNGYYDGYFVLNNLAPMGGGTGTNSTNTFNYDQGAIFGIIPVPEQFDTVEIYDTVCKGYGDYTLREYTLKATATDTLLRHLDTIFHLHLAVIKTNNAKFNSNDGGFGQTEMVEFCRLVGVTMPECMYTRENHVFVGWSKSKSGAGDIYQPGDIVAANSSVTFYARWQDTTVGIAPVDRQTIALHPNPASSELNVTLGSNTPATLYLIDALGQTVISQKMDSPEAKIDLRSLPSGLYILRAVTPQGTYNRRVIKR